MTAAGLQHLVAGPCQRHAGLADLLVPDRVAQRIVLAVGLGERTAQRVVALDPDQGLVGVVGEDQPPLRVDDRDRGRDGVQHAAQQVLAGRGLAPAQIRLETGRPIGQEALLTAESEEIAGTGAELEMVDRAQEEVGGSSLQSAIAELTVLVDGDDDHRHVVMLAALAERPHERGTVHLGHVEVGDDQIAAQPSLERIQRLDRARVSVDLQTFLDRQGKTSKDIAVRDAVVDDDYSGHSPLRRSRIIRPGSTVWTAARAYSVGRYYQVIGE